MSQRSATNPRNTNRDEQVTGMARKSASSAKPATANSGTVRVVATSGKEKRKQMEQGENLEGLSKEEKKARKAERRRQEDRIYAASDALMRADPTYVHCNHVWWAITGVGIGALVILLILSYVVTDTTLYSRLQVICLILGYGGIIGAIVYDIAKVRPIRNQYQTIVEGMSESKLDSVIDKATAEVERQELEEEAKKQARKEARKAARKKE